jgi:hypothetical protein
MSVVSPSVATARALPLPDVAASWQCTSVKSGALLYCPLSVQLSVSRRRSLLRPFADRNLHGYIEPI